MASTCLRICAAGLSQNLRNTSRYCLSSSVGSVRWSSAASEQAQNASETEAKLSKEVERLGKEVETQKEKITDLDDKYKRALAEAENTRRRLMKQIDDAKIFGIQSFCKDLLDVADVLHRATETVPKDQVNQNNPHLKSLYEGLKMTEAELLAVFKRHGLKQVNPIGEKFNPNEHEALFQQPVEGKESGMVIAVTKIGYKLHERTIRPALVGVAS